MPTIKEQIGHTSKIVDGFNELLAMKAIKVVGTTIFLYPELWQSNPPAWIKNAYRYFRLKLKVKEGTTIYFKHMDTGQLLAKFENHEVNFS